MLIVKNIIFSFLAIIVVGCDYFQNPGNNNKVQSSLSQLEGKYVWHAELNKFVYSKKIEIENILSANDKNKIIHVLASCIDNDTLSNSVLNKTKIKLGVICYEALSQTIYHEPLLENGDIGLKWAGHISPEANTSELKAAKNAWNEVIKSKKYNFL